MTRPWLQWTWWQRQPPPDQWSEETWTCLYEVLGCDDWIVRNRLAQWLVSIHHPQLLSLLREALADATNANRRNTAFQILLQKKRLPFPFLQDLVESADPDLRLFGVQLIGQHHERRLLSVLRKRLEDENPNVVAATIEALGQLGDSSALPDLRRLFAHADIWHRYPIILAMGAIGDPSVFDIMTEHLEDPLLGPAVVQALEGLWDAQAVALAVRALTIPTLQTRVLHHTGRWFRWSWPEPLMERYVQQMRVWTSQKSLRQVMTSLPWDRWLRDEAPAPPSCVLPWGGLAAIPAVTDWLADRMDDPTAVDTILDTIPWLTLQTPDAWIHLWERAQSVDVLHALIQWHRSICQADVVRDAIRARWDRLPADTQRLIIITIRSVVQWPETWTWLTLGWQSRDPEVQDALNAWLVTLPAADQTHVLDAVRDWTTSPQAWQRAAVMEADAVLRPLAFLNQASHWMRDSDAWVRQRVLNHVIRLRKNLNTEETLLFFLRMALTDEHPAVQALAVRVYPRDASDFPSVMRTALYGADLRVRMEAIRRIAESREMTLMASLMEQARSAGSPVQIEALRHLGKFDDAGVLTLYETLYAQLGPDGQWAILEGMAHMRHHTSEVFTFCQQLLPVHRDESMGVRILMTMAAVAPEDFCRWMSQYEAIIDDWLSPAQGISVLQHLDHPQFPRWAEPWLYVEELWPAWVKMARARPAWRRALMEKAPHRLRRWMEFFGIGEDDVDETR